MTQEKFITEIRLQLEPLRRFLLVLCHGNTHEADDIAQDSAMKAYLAKDGFRKESKFSTWLFRIGYNCFLDRNKRYTGIHSDIHEAMNTCADELADDKFRYEELYLAIDELSSNEKAAILLFYKEDLSIEDIASVTGLSESNVKVCLHRGRLHIKQYIEDGKR